MDFFFFFSPPISSIIKQRSPWWSMQKRRRAEEKKNNNNEPEQERHIETRNVCIITPQSVSSRFSLSLSLLALCYNRLISSWPSLLSSHYARSHSNTVWINSFQSITCLPACLPLSKHISTPSSYKSSEKRKNRREPITATKKNRLMYSPNTSLYQYSSVFIEYEELLRRESNRSMCVRTHTHTTRENLYSRNVRSPCMSTRERGAMAKNSFILRSAGWLSLDYSFVRRHATVLSPLSLINTQINICVSVRCICLASERARISWFVLHTRFSSDRQRREREERRGKERNSLHVHMVVGLSIFTFSHSTERAKFEFLRAFS